MKKDVIIIFILLMVVPLAVFGQDKVSCPLETPSARYSPLAGEINHHVFKADGEREAIETFFLRSGEKITIGYRGCEYEALTVRVESSHLARANGSINAVYSAASKALSSLARVRPKNNYAFPMLPAAEALQREGTKATPAEIGEEISLPGFGEMSAAVSIRSYQRKKKIGIVVLEMYRGPL